MVSSGRAVFVNQPSKSVPPSHATGLRRRSQIKEKVTIADAQEVTLPNGRPGWEGYCPECGGRLFAIRRKPADG